MDTLKDIRPIFIVGMNGSGTTVLLDCLNNHPNIFGFRRETKIIPSYLNPGKNTNQLEDDRDYLCLWNRIRNEYVFKIVNNGMPIPLPDNWEKLPRHLAYIFHHIFMYFAGREDKSRWCEKTPNYACHIQAIGNLFPAARFIHIIRDGRACAASLYRRWGYHPQLMMYRWKKTIRSARQQAALIDRDNYIEIRYEDFTDDPVTWMQKICDFIGEEFSPSSVRASRVRRFTGNRNMVVGPMPEKWRETFDVNLLGRLEKIGGGLLYELGYTEGRTNSDYNPPKYLLIYWMYLGYLMGLLRGLLKNIREGKFEKNSSFLQFLKIRIKTRWKV